MPKLYQKLYDRLEDNSLLQCIRGGLVMAIPVLMLGCFSLVLRSFPSENYQAFLTAFGGGFLYTVFDILYDATFGMLSVYMTLCISWSFMQRHAIADVDVIDYGGIFASLISFSIFSGVLTTGFQITTFGVKGMFISIVCALTSSALYRELRILLKGHQIHFYADGADDEFNNAIGMILPIVLVSLIFAFINIAIVIPFGANDFQSFFVSIMDHIFENMGRNLGSALLYVVLSSVMWFFGIHGSDILENVCDHLFTPALAENVQLVAAGQLPTEIFSKTFIDVFVLMGGCGGAMCLLLALIFSKRRSNRNLARMAAIPMLFNINELLVFGLPIVFNPILLVPFLLVPVLSLITSTLAMQFGWVPIPVHEVNWTTPIFFSGWIATGSAAGMGLQLFNLIVGTAIYFPYVRLYDREKLRNSTVKLNRLIETLNESECTRVPVRLLELPGSRGLVARGLAEDLSVMLANSTPTMYYQPQFDHDGKCIGAEALLRWTHPMFGMMYPPLVVKLAQESGRMARLDEAIFRCVIQDLPALKKLWGNDIRLCVNISPEAIQTNQFELFLTDLQSETGFSPENLCLEVTEQMTLQLTEQTIARFERLKTLGYSLAIDDFSMGSTSLKYLQQNLFNLVKLDGSLVRDMVDNPRSERIVASLVQLSHDLGFRVLSEYVETQAQRDKLAELGCLLYQGYLYSKAEPLEVLQEKSVKAHAN